MACSIDGDCLAVLSNTVCTSNQCECDTGFSGPGNQINSLHTIIVFYEFILSTSAVGKIC